MDQHALKEKHTHTRTHKDTHVQLVVHPITYVRDHVQSTSHYRKIMGHVSTRRGLFCENDRLSVHYPLYIHQGECHFSYYHTAVYQIDQSMCMKY